MSSPRTGALAMMVLCAVGVGSAPAMAAAPRPRTYANCTALNHVYPHGVGKPGARDHVSGHTPPVTTFTRSAAVYALNTKSDRDRDGIACEKR